MKRWLTVVGRGFLLALVMVHATQARPGFPGPPPGGIDADRAAAMVRAQTGGRVLGVKTWDARGRRVHTIKVLLPGGQVRLLRVDAATGKPLD